MRKKGIFDEKRKIRSASFSLKKKIPLVIEESFEDYIQELGGWTTINKKFMLKESNLPEKEFDKEHLNFTFELMKISKEEREYQKKFRRFFIEEVLKLDLDKKEKEEWKNYLKNEEYL